MVWHGLPFFRSSEESEDPEAGKPAPGMRPPTEKLTAFQLFYIFGLDGVGAMVLSGGINFAIAYGAYIGREQVA